MTVIVILALVALFIGLRLYSVLGERTGHEQQPILKPADPDARVGPQVSQPSPPPSASAPTLLAQPTTQEQLPFVEAHPLIRDLHAYQTLVPVCFSSTQTPIEKTKII